MFAEAKSLFFQHLIARARSVRTVISYGEALDQFSGFFLASDPYRRLDDVRAAHIEEFLVLLRKGGRKESTVANRYRSLRRFFRWCKARGFVRLDPTDGLSEPRVRVEAVMPYTDGEVRRMMLATRQWPALALRDQAMIALLYNTGMRAGELVTLHPEHIREGAVKVRGKGAKERWVALEPTTEKLILAWLTGREDRRLVFGLSVSALDKTLKRLAAAAQVSHVHAHRFRDTFAVRFLENGGGIDDLQVLLGHSKIETTLRYVMWQRERRAMDAQRRFAPFAARIAG